MNKAKAFKIARQSLGDKPARLAEVSVEGPLDDPVITLKALEHDTTIVLYGNDIDKVLMMATIAQRAKAREEATRR